MLADAVFEALADAGNLSPKDLQAGAVAYQGEATIEAGGIGATVADYLAMAPANVTALSSNCAGSLVATHLGWNLVASGKYDRVLVAGFEKTGDLLEPYETIPVSTDVEYDYMLGFVHRDGFAMMESMYCKKYNYPTLVPFAAWAVQCDWYAKRNPKAFHYDTPPLTIEEAMARTPEGFIKRSLAVGEGASAIILVPADEAKAYNPKPVYLDGVAYKCTSHYLGDHFYYKGLNYPGLEKFDVGESALTVAAREEAYAMAGITAEDIDLAQVYDMGASGIVQMEALGIFPLGEGGRAVMAGETAIGGRCPANTDGGRIRFGHASGADGTDMVGESTIQLRGEAGERQVPDARIAVCQSTAGTNAAIAVAVLRRE